MMKKTKREPDAVEPDPATTGAAGADATDTADQVQRREAEPVKGPAIQPDSIESYRRRVEELEDTLLRARAEHQNAQRRAAVERSQAIRYANADLLRSLLGVIDDFDRSLEAAQTTDHHDAVVDGVRLVRENFVRALTQHGLEPITATHQPFDPSQHEAMMQKPSDEYPPGTVLEELAKGYRLGDRLLRPAKVIVSKATDEGAPAERDAREALDTPRTGEGIDLQS